MNGTQDPINFVVFIYMCKFKKKQICVRIMKDQTRFRASFFLQTLMNPQVFRLNS